MLRMWLRRWCPVMVMGWIAIMSIVISRAAEPSAAPPREVSGIFPSLACFNDENECGIGGVVPWADRLWVITYAPHKPQGSTDKLYEITPELRQIIRPESVGGTPANRMIHAESQQLFLGPYAIDARGHVRVIPPDRMFGRLTGNARHLFDPAHKIYFATMEEGIYEVDVATLNVTELWSDEQQKSGRHADLPGYHGKGLYSGQGLLIYANNGEHGAEALRRPDIPSGVLAAWDGTADHWEIVRRNQFTEVTGPGGLTGNADSQHDPIWAVGWDHRSLLLQVLDHGNWHLYRLPKSSHSYDGAHGWNTEWPRIRDIGEDQLLMTMHGAFWSFPRTFSAARSSGIRPRSNYLKVVGDFCRWRDRIVLGCDDTARSEFLNKRKLKGNFAGAGQSQSNLRFIDPADLDHLGPVIGRGAVWLDEQIPAGVPSAPYLFSGYDRRALHLAHQQDDMVTFTLEVDRDGDGHWTTLRDVPVAAHGSAWVEFDAQETGAWLRLRTDREAENVTAFLHYSTLDPRTSRPDPLFDGIARPDDRDTSGGLLHVRGANFRTLRFVARDGTGEIGGYDLDGNLQLKRTDDAVGIEWVKKNVSIPQGVINSDAASVLYVDDAGRRWRLPKGDPAFDQAGPLGAERVCREVCTERDLLNVQGTFYELPAENAGGFAKVRPIATHNRRITDYASYRGLLVLSGVSQQAPESSSHIVRSDDGRCALWVGCVDDLWKFGKPRGVGGPWKETVIQPDQPSDPYLMTGYDRKRVTCSHNSPQPVRFTLQADFTGLGNWTAFHTMFVPARGSIEYEFPASFQCYWIRAVADQATRATVTFNYE